jgi:hypothetical protein
LHKKVTSVPPGTSSKAKQATTKDKAKAKPKSKETAMSKIVRPSDPHDHQAHADYHDSMARANPRLAHMHLRQKKIRMAMVKN